MLETFEAVVSTAFGCEADVGVDGGGGGVVLLTLPVISRSLISCEARV